MLSRHFLIGVGAITWADRARLCGHLTSDSAWQSPSCRMVRRSPASPESKGCAATAQGSAPGPITNKKGEWTWRMDVDNMATRACHLEATLPGYVSTQIDVSALHRRHQQRAGNAEPGAQQKRR